jgi:hypothetical protein
MTIQNKIFEVDQDLVYYDKTVYYLQKILKYDEGETISSIIGVWDSSEGDIDEAAQSTIRQEETLRRYKETLRRYNEVKPYTFIIRKVKADIHFKVIESESNYYGNTSKKNILQCANCNVNINYGDEVVIKKYESDDKYFCCNDCLAEYEDATTCFPDDNEYDKLFIESNESYQ